MPLGLRRYQHEGHLHFITFSCYQRLPFLSDDGAKKLFLHRLEELRRRHDFRITGYVLMPEHLHLLISEPTVGELASTLRVLKGETSKHLKEGRKQFWQRRYYDFNIFTEDKRIEKLKYMHRNPVSRGLVERPEDYPWSSFRHYAIAEPGPVEIDSKWTSNWKEPRAHSSR